ncbi:MAG: SufD family Fe-S cluster assembly protein [Bacteroidales bacterium]|jgi:Fe-S cluster assembly protein SufD|nr:SufD family Fe-S cluster assembly protein [Bacteroidales bacterium]
MTTINSKQVQGSQLVFENATFAAQKSLVENHIEISVSEGVTIISVSAHTKAHIHILHNFHGTLPHTQIEIRIQSGAHALIIETYAVTEKLPKANITTNIAVGNGAHCEFISLQHLSEGAQFAQTISVQQSENSHYTAHVYQICGSILHSKLGVEKIGTQANTAIYGLSYPHRKEQFEFDTTVKHSCPDCETAENFKIIAADHSVGIFGGMIYVAPHAVKTAAQQSNKNILLSPNARIFSKPQLEIYTDDVTCNHGSTTGQLNNDALWYMQARGIAPETAKQLLIQAFVHEITEKLPTQELRDFVAAKVQ